MMRKRIKLKEFAEINNISYRTALRHWQAGLIEGIQNGSGAILVSEYKSAENFEDVKIPKPLVFIRSADERMVEGRQKKIDLFMKDAGFENYDTILWDGFIFQANPFLEKILEKDYNYIVVETLTDLFGVNYKILAKLFLEKGIRIDALDKPIPVSAIIYEFYLSAVGMAKAAVGMTGYKKRLFESANKIFS
jgi:predicted site-specific integrase-resolvase